MPAVKDFPEPAVNQASYQLVAEHAASYFNKERVLMQVSTVPHTDIVKSENKQEQTWQQLLNN